MTSPEVALSMLGVGFSISTEDERMADFVRLLWEPFLGSPAPDSVDVAIEQTEDGWRLGSEGSPVNSATDPWVFGAVLRNFLTLRAIRGAQGVIPLHASVIERDGAHLVLSGPPEAGKTTLTLALLERGWRYVSDDMAPIDASTARARGFPKALSVRDPSRWADFADRWTVPDWLPPPENASLIPASAFEASPGETYRPAAIVFSRYSRGASPLHEPLSPARIIGFCAENLQDRSSLPEGGLGRLAEWISGTEGARIEYGSTEEALKLLGKCLAGLPGDGIIS